MERIVVPYGMIGTIAKKLGRRRATVSAALKGATNSELAIRIRAMAVAMGGVVMVMKGGKDE